MNKVEIKRYKNRLYIGNSNIYLIERENGDFSVYDDGEYEGTYVGGLPALEERTEEEALRYIFDAI